VLKNLAAHLDPRSAAPPVFECNSVCACGDLCWNRQVQHGVQVRLRVCESNDGKGLGVCCLDSIEAGRFVCEYAGDVVGRDEALRRLAKQTLDEMNYLIAVREHTVIGVTTTYVDPKRNGNVGRFLNHSCAPNLAMVPVRADSEVPMLALFARRDVGRGEELCFDYGGRHDKLHNDSSATRKRCHCGAADCRGYLPLNEDLFVAEGGT